MSKYEDGASKEELKEEVKADNNLKIEDMEEAIRMLLITENVEIEGKKAKLAEHNFECKGVRRNPFRDWKRKAIKENSDNLANIKKEQDTE